MPSLWIPNIKVPAIIWSYFELKGCGRRFKSSAPVGKQSSTVIWLIKGFCIPSVNALNINKIQAGVNITPLKSKYFFFCALYSLCFGSGETIGHHIWKARKNKNNKNPFCKKEVCERKFKITGMWYRKNKKENSIKANFGEKKSFLLVWLLVSLTTFQTTARESLPK